MARYVIGFDLGATKMLAGIVGADFKIQARSRTKTDANETGQMIFSRIVQTIRNVMQEAKVHPSDLAGIGVGSPGPLDPATGTIIDCANLNWHNFPLGRKLEQEFGCPVAVDNDVNLGTYGEFHFGAGQGSRHLVGIFPGTGIGGGLILEGKIYHGASGSAGELGHMTLDPNGPLCGCGKHGCYEAYAGRHVIAAQVAVCARRGQAPHLLLDAGSDLKNIRSRALLRSIEAGDTAVADVVRRAAFQIGLVGAQMINALSPDTLVLGGGLVQAMPRIYLEEAKHAVMLHAMPFLRKFCKIKQAQLGDDAVLMGAARLIWEQLGAETPTKKKKTKKPKKTGKKIQKKKAAKKSSKENPKRKKKAAR